MPVWQRFTQDSYDKNYQKRLLCRIRSYGAADIADILSVMGVEKEKLFDLPVYNKYFVVGAGGDLPESVISELPSQISFSEPIRLEVMEEPISVFRTPQLVKESLEVTPSAKKSQVIVKGKGPSQLENDLNLNNFKNVMSQPRKLKY
jgi:hypothetical protein